MSAPVEHARWSQRALAVVFGAVLVFLVAGASPASAHPRLVSTDPVPQATVQGPWPKVVVRFNEEMNWPLSHFKVTRADNGESVIDGAPTYNPEAATLPLRPDASGVLLVSWVVVSLDAHPVQGQYTFAVIPPAPPPPPPGQASAAGPSGPSPPLNLENQLAKAAGLAKLEGRAGSTGLGWLIRGGRSIEIILLDLVLGILLLRALVLRPSVAGGPGSARLMDGAPNPRRVFGTLFLAGAASAALMPVLFWLYAKRVTDLVPTSSFGDVLGSSVGRVWLVKAVLWVAFTAASAVAVRRLRPGTRSDGLPLALALSVVCAFVLSTHARGISPAWVFLPMMWGHVLLTAFWAGGLLALLLVVFPGRDPDRIWPAVGRFSTIMTVTAGLIVASGAVMLLKLAGNWKSMWCTDFGLVAGTKIAMVTVALVIGAVNNRLVAAQRRMCNLPAGSRRGRAGASVSTLRRIVAIEAVVLCSVLLLSAALGETELPPLFKGRVLPGLAQDSVRPGLFGSGCN